MLDIMMKIRKSIMPINGTISDYIVKDTYYTTHGMMATILDKNGKSYTLTLMENKRGDLENKVRQAEARLRGSKKLVDF
jgi:hypothetical protein